MAEEDLLLNFSIGEEPLAAKAVVKGGTWRARRRAQRQEQWAKGTLKRKESGDFERPSKRPKSEAEDGLTEASATQHSGKHPAHNARRQSTKEKSNAGQEPKQVISSLFSYNPSPNSQTTTKQPELPEDDVEPSNAPLTQEQLNFTSLNLAPRIATHLTNKMLIKRPTAIQKAALEQLLKDDTDAFIQAETGSGKTLAYLLPIVQRLLHISSDLRAKGEPGLSRISGLFAIILVPTRELSKQIATVLESLLRCLNWIVAGSVTGGENRNHEKAKLRNGLNILVATPGRLADHLDHTSILDASQVRWLVLDEGDRLMELGFEEDLRRIITKLDNRLTRGKERPLEGLPKRRINILCSATMKMDVQKLGEISLKDAVHIRANAGSRNPAEAELDDKKEHAEGYKAILRAVATDAPQEAQFTVPAQLKQTYTVVSAKQRLVTLFAYLKRSFTGGATVKKAIVFLSCADSVDFLFETFSHLKLPDGDVQAQNDDDNDDADDMKISHPGSEQHPKANEKRKLRTGLHQSGGAKSSAKHEDGEFIKTWAISPSLSRGSDELLYVYRLHGSLPQSLRTTTLKSFKKTITPAILLCTDVASRGLDLPDVDLVVEYDPPFSKDDHLHRIGRTARAGRDGRATIFLLPGCEEGYVDILRDERKDHGALITGFSPEAHLRAVFTSHAAPPQFDKHSTTPRGQRRQLLAAHKATAQRSWEDAATEWQLAVERRTLDEPRNLERARRAFQSHVRAYATHVAAERHLFDMKALHLGHLAKAFGLRDKPGSINVPGLRQNGDKVKSERRRAGGGEKGKRSAEGGAGKGRPVRPDGEFETAEADAVSARRKMQALGRKMGTGAGEFNLA